LGTLPTDDGIPTLADALTVLVCDLRDEHPAGDHTVVIGRVRAVHPLRDGTGLDTVSLRMRGTTEFRKVERQAPQAPRSELSQHLAVHKDEAGSPGRHETGAVPAAGPTSRTNCRLLASGEWASRCSRRRTSVRLVGCFDAGGSDG